ncbi:MAG: DUF1573 domain-containing protein [Deltaproteobacteria bacterium]|nr:DUF1573 domain-containing protein [Deltaproteobacteria bacterium]
MKSEEETILKIIYQTLNRPGPFEKRVFLFTNIPDQKEITITIKGMVREAPVPKIRVEPRKLRLGLINTNSVSNLSCRITNEGREPLTITKIHMIEGDTVYFDGKKQGNLVIKPKESTSIKIDFTPMTEGPFTRVIFFETNAKNARNGRYAIMVIGEALKEGSW